MSHLTTVANDNASSAASLAGGAGYDGVELLHVDWVQELPEDLDVCIAQRDFEAAVDLVQKSTSLFHHLSFVSVQQ